MLQVRKLQSRKVRYLAQGHPVSKFLSQGPHATQAFLLVKEGSLRVEDSSGLCLEALWCVVQTFSLYGQSCLQPLALSAS